jgi:hypothetical protein
LIFIKSSSINESKSVLIIAIVSLLHVCNAEDEGEKHAEGSHSDIADSKEVVFTSKSVCGTDDETLLTLEWLNLIVVVDLEVVVSWLEWSINFTPELTEVWKTSGSHPDNEVLVSHIVPLVILPGTLILDILELEIDIRSPSNVFVIDLDFDVVCGACFGFVKFKSIIEETLGYESTWNSWAFI